MNEKMKSKPLFRTVQFDKRSIDEEARSAELSFSSEEPVDRWFGLEILDHGSSSVRLGRLNTGGPLLVGHNANDHVGVIESVSIGNDRRGRAVVRFGKSARAEEIFNDVKDGIRKNVSVGYRVHKAVLEEIDNETDSETYRITDWEPFEISLVSIPADVTVGVGRSSDYEENDIEFIRGNSTMEDNEENNVPVATQTPAAPQVDVRAMENKGETRERKRVDALLAAGEQYGAQDLARQFISNGGSESDLNKAILERMGKPSATEAESPEIGMSDSDVRDFSFVRAMNALANPTDQRAQEAAAFEFECSNAAADKMRKEARGILVPVDVLKRDLNVGTASAGGDTVSTNLLSGSFIEMLRNQALMMEMATLLTDLNGNIAIPRQLGGAAAYWIGENGNASESSATFDQVTLSPETVAAYTEISRKLLLQSSLDVEAFARRELVRTLALEIDRVCIHGSGSGNEPLGIMNVTGIGAVAGGANGAAPNWGNVVDLETEVAVDNAAVGSLAYLTNARVRGALKKTEKATGTAQFIWNEISNQVNGYDAKVTNQVPRDLTKGSGTDLSALIFGNFADLIIGMWGGLDLQVNPYSLDTKGAVRVTAFQDIDTAVRHPESFAVMSDIVTN